MPETILVIGGSGMLGEPVARKLVSDGYAVRLLARDPDAMRRRFPRGFDVVKGDVEDPQSVRRALQGCTGVHVSLMGGPRPEDFDRIEHHGTATVATEAARAGVARLTYLSGAPARPENSRDPGSKAKLDAEAAIRASGVPYTIFQATWMMEALPMFVRGRRAMVIGTQKHPVRWIAADDYASMVSRAFATPEAAYKSLFVVGPEAYSKPEALARYCDTVAPGVKVTFLPVWLMSAVGLLSFDAQLKADVRRMAFYDEIGDAFGDPTEANALLGTPETTLPQWCAARTAVATAP